VEASSIPSDPRRRKPDDQTCCDGVVEPSTIDLFIMLDVRMTALSAAGAAAGTGHAELRLPTGHHCIDRTAGLRGVRAADVESPSGRVSRISGNLHQHDTSAGLPNSAQNRQSATFNASDGQKQRAPVTKGKAHFGTTHNYGQVHTKCQTPSNGQTDEWTRGSLRFSRLYVVSFRGVHPIGVIELNRNLRGGGVKSANSAEKNTRNLVS